MKLNQQNLTSIVLERKKIKDIVLKIINIS
jgi:hypothetical protein